jgi:hypothetical protein
MSTAKPTHTTRRALLASLPVAAATLTPAAATALSGQGPQTAGLSSADPIYDAIEEHRRAWRNFPLPVIKTIIEIEGERVTSVSQLFL